MSSENNASFLQIGPNPTTSFVLSITFEEIIGIDKWNLPSLNLMDLSLSFQIFSQFIETDHFSPHQTKQLPCQRDEFRLKSDIEHLSLFFQRMNVLSVYLQNGPAGTALLLAEAQVPLQSIVNQLQTSSFSSNTIAQLRRSFKLVPKEQLPFVNAESAELMAVVEVRKLTNSGLWTPRTLQLTIETIEFDGVDDSSNDAEKIAIAASYFSYVRKHCRYIALGDYGQLEETDVNDTLEFHPSNDIDVLDYLESHSMILECVKIASSQTSRSAPKVIATGEIYFSDIISQAKAIENPTSDTEVRIQMAVSLYPIETQDNEDTVGRVVVSVCLKWMPIHQTRLGSQEQQNETSHNTVGFTTPDRPKRSDFENLPLPPLTPSQYSPRTPQHGQEIARQLHMSIHLVSIKSLRQHGWIRCRYSYYLFGMDKPEMTHPLVNVMAGTEVVLPNSFCRFSFVATRSQVESAFQDTPLGIEVWNKDKMRYHPDQLLGLAVLPLTKLMQAKAQYPHGEGNPPAVQMLECNVPILQNSKQSQTQIQEQTAQSQQFTKVGLLHVKIFLEDEGPIEKEDEVMECKSLQPSQSKVSQVSQLLIGSTKAIENGLNASETAGNPDYAVAWELEMWKRAEEAKFQAELKVRMSNRLAELEMEWKKNEKEMKEREEKRQVEYLKLESSLKKRLLELERRERQIKVVEEENQREREAKMAELQVLHRRMKDECQHKISMEKAKSSSLEQRIQDMQQQVEQARNRVIEIERDFEEYRRVQRKTPEEKLRMELVSLRGEKTELEAKIQREEAEKLKHIARADKYKEQVLILVRELERVKKSIKLKAQKEMEQRRMKYIAQEERYILDGDREELHRIRQELQGIRSQSNPDSSNGVNSKLYHKRDIMPPNQTDTVPIHLETLSHDSTPVDHAFHTRHTNAKQAHQQENIVHLQSERSELLSTGLYTEKDAVIQAIDAKIAKLCDSDSIPLPRPPPQPSGSTEFKELSHQIPLYSNNEFSSNESNAPKTNWSPGVIHTIARKSDFNHELKEDENIIQYHPQIPRHSQPESVKKISKPSHSFNDQSDRFHPAFTEHDNSTSHTRNPPKFRSDTKPSTQASPRDTLQQSNHTELLQAQMQYSPSNPTNQLTRQFNFTGSGLKGQTSPQSTTAKSPTDFRSHIHSDSRSNCEQDSYLEHENESYPNEFTNQMYSERIEPKYEATSKSNRRNDSHQNPNKIEFNVDQLTQSDDFAKSSPSILEDNFEWGEFMQMRSHFPTLNEEIHSPYSREWNHVESQNAEFDFNPWEE